MLVAATVAACLVAQLPPGLNRSLPRTHGEVVVSALRAPTEIARDARGIPVIDAADHVDATRGLGFVHAQDRFFQMDLTRRLAAGRLAEVLGPLGVDYDLERRGLRFEHVARAAWDDLDDRARTLLTAYAEGVNAGLADLGAAPPEYSVLRATPAPWAPHDSILVVFAMWDSLNRSAGLERMRGVMGASLDPALVRFLTPTASRFDPPPLAGDSAPREPLAIPPASVLDLRASAFHAAPAAPLVAPGAPVPGSNAWLVAGTRTAHGAAILANDPHLRITAPGVWYRAELRWGGRRVVGATLPGSPGVIIGSNGDVAWGFTNTTADFQDVVIVEVDPDDPSRYLGPDGPEPFGEIVERIEVRGAEPRTLTLRTTRWGTVSGADGQGRPTVLRWTALDPTLVDMDIVHLAEARTLEEAMDTAAGWRGPSQNAMLASRDGRIGWVVTGHLPRRRGFDGTVPASWRAPGVGWDGALDEAMRPRVIDPPGGILVTANNRTVPVAWARRLGDAWALGVRAERIDTLLAGRDQLDEDDLLAIQLDTRVTLFDFYRELALAAGPEAPDVELVAEARRIVAAWDGTADHAQPGLPILNEFRDTLHRMVIDPLVAPCRDLDPGFRFRWPQQEETVRRLLETRPAHLLAPGHADWDALIRAAFRRAIETVTRRAPRTGLATPWGMANQASIRHPMSSAAPAFASLLDMPADPLSGHYLAVRVATPSFGASLRMVVSPGHEDEGILHAPGGQAGHPMSPHYRDVHAAWVAGRRTPFLAGPARSRLRLVPAREAPETPEVR